MGCQHLIRIALAVAVMLGAGAAAAQDVGVYPAKRMEIIVPFPAGGTADFLARLIGQKLAESWGQPVVVSNKPGATGSLGAETAAQAPPDGHTLLVTSYANRGVLFTPDPPTPQPARDLVPVAVLIQAPLVLVAHPALPARSVRELLVLAAEKQGALNYASIGNGTPSHLAMEMLKKSAAVKMTHVPYKGSAQALADVIAGHVPMMFDSVVSSSEQVKGGKLKPLAVSTSTRLPTLPNVPTISESGVPGFDVFTWAVLYVPAGTPANRMDKLRDAMGRILKMPDVVERLAAQGAIVPDSMTQAQVSAFVRDDVAMWRKLIKEAAIQAD